MDSEFLFLSCALHDLGLTDHAQGPHRFKIEGASAARTFLVDRDYPSDRAQMVWDNIALHTWDINLFRDNTSRMTQLGIAHDVVGVPHGQKLDPAAVGELHPRYPRLNFCRGFHQMLEHERTPNTPIHTHFIPAQGSHTVARQSRSWTCALSNQAHSAGR